MYATMCNTDLHFYSSLTVRNLSVPILFTVMILYKHLHMGRIVSEASSMYGFDL